MELVGYCCVCGTEVYCRDGFLDGQSDDQSRLWCHRCFEEQNEEETGKDRSPAK